MIYLANVDHRRPTTRVAKWGNSLAIRVPAAAEFDLAEGDEVELSSVGKGKLEIRRDPAHEAALARIRELCVPLPPGFRFDREEANARGPE